MSDISSGPSSPDSVDKPKVLLIKILGVCVPWNFARQTLVTFAQEQCHSYINRNLDEEHVSRLAEQLHSQNVRQKAAGLHCPLLNERSQTDPATYKTQLSAYVSWCLTNNMFKCGTPVSELAGYIWGEGFSGGTIKTE
jgi:methionine salvage enolase-phosphatase E1